MFSNSAPRALASFNIDIHTYIDLLFRRLIISYLSGPDSKVDMHIRIKTTVLDVTVVPVCLSGGTFRPKWRPGGNRDLGPWVALEASFQLRWAP